MIDQKQNIYVRIRSQKIKNINKMKKIDWF